MKKIILFLLLATNTIACKQKTMNMYSNTSIHSQKDIASEKDSFFAQTEKLESISLPFSIRPSYNVENYYYWKIDTFLLFHKFKKKLDHFINNKFHKGTLDFLKGEYMVYPYYQEREDTPPFAIKKIQINDDVMGIFYAYIQESDVPIPRIELQTFDKQGNYIDSIIIFYQYVFDFTGRRKFHINEKLILKVDTEYDYSAEMNNGEDFSYHSTDIFKITETGKIVRQ